MEIRDFRIPKNADPALRQALDVLRQIALVAQSSRGFSMMSDDAIEGGKFLWASDERMTLVSGDSFTLMGG